MTLPDAPEQLVAGPPDDALRALLSECAGTDFEALRDTAIIRMLTDTGCHAGELAGLDVDGIDFVENTAMVLGEGRAPHHSATRHELPFGSTYEPVPNTQKPTTTSKLSGSDAGTAPRGHATDIGAMARLVTLAEWAKTHGLSLTTVRTKWALREDFPAH
ncbi:site-specific integrase [Nocardia sp. NBC_01327]|uniref:site-specific integrase n=1 Tax=Nocardia sp. NBC_01327 TaxID=2903593 RepID=UPI002E113E16|nr:site-specific integrase [Nocardia sp. NBC_01327]